MNRPAGAADAVEAPASGVSAATTATAVKMDSFLRLCQDIPLLLDCVRNPDVRSRTREGGADLPRVWHLVSGLAVLARTAHGFVRGTPAVPVPHLSAGLSLIVAHEWRQGGGEGTPLVPLILPAGKIRRLTRSRGRAGRSASRSAPAGRPPSPSPA